MKLTNKDKAVVLIPGKLNDHAVRSIENRFECVRIDAADQRFLSPDLVENVRAIASMTIITGAFMDGLPKLEIIANFGVGYDDVDAVHAAQKGIMVTNTPDVLTEEVADTAIGLLINTVRELPKAETYLRSGRWQKDGPYPLTAASLRGRKAGVFGLGRIGLAIARRLEAFGLPVSYHNRNRRDDVAFPYHATLSGLAAAVDILICVAPGGAATQKAIGKTVLKALGPDGIFINVGRGSSVDEAALIRALEDGTILAAGLDVFAGEPHVPEALLQLPNVSLLPHVASASQHTRNAMAELQVENLVSWFETGEAITPVPECQSLGRRRALS